MNSMNLSPESYANPYDAPIAIEAELDERTAFIRRTYTHLTGAIFAFAALCAVLVNTIGEQMTQWVTAGQYNWLMVLGAFIGVSWIANRMALSGASAGVQYAALAIYVVAEAFIFTPLLFVAANFADPGIIPAAGLLTLVVFGGLTAYVFISKADFKGLGKYLAVGSLVALGLILGSILFGFSLPTLAFSGVMIVLAAGYILYDTSNVLHHYRTDMHVAASLALFASVALMFWYVLQFLMSIANRD